MRTSRVLGRTSVSGLITLLQRHVPPDRLKAVCCQEWRKSQPGDIPPARRAQVEAVVRNMADRPAEALRQIQAILRAKGTI